MQWLTESQRARISWYSQRQSTATNLRSRFNFSIGGPVRSQAICYSAVLGLLPA
jgi:hypothetical protein